MEAADGSCIARSHDEETRMRIHVYEAGGQSAVTHPDADGQQTLRGFIGIEVDERVYRVGDEVELDVDVTLIELFGDAPGHVIRHHCREVSVTAAYAGQERTVKAHVTAPVREVLDEILKAFELQGAAAADLVLRLPDSSTDLALGAPIGAFVSKGVCDLVVDLVHLVRPQG